MTVPLFRVHVYDHEHHATVIIACEGRERARVVASEFVAAMHLGYYPADHQRRWPELVGIETASSWFDADEAFPPVVESIEVVDRDALGAA